MTVRIIPRLDIKGPNLVKGIHFEGLRVMGKPEVFARHYYEHGADELFYQDAVASLYGRNSLLDIVEKTSREIFIPLCVGGGLRTVDDIREVLRAGADKVAINTAAIENPQVISDASRIFGSSTIVVSIEAVKNSDGSYEALVNYGRDLTGVNAIEWANKAVELGAGELMVTSVDREGTAEGFDLDLTEAIATAVSVPVIAGGGAGTVDDVHDVVTKGHANAASIASSLHYHALEEGDVRAELAEFETEGNTTFLKLGKTNSKMNPFTIHDCKKHLQSHGIDCRVE